MAAPAAVALALYFGFSLACETPANTKIVALPTVGGDGKALTYSLSGSAPIISDLILSNGVLWVGPNGIAPAHCGSTADLQVDVSQP
jgi:hypothetical protein